MKARGFCALLMLLLAIWLVVPGGAAASEFIVEDGRLVAYTGEGGWVDVPDGVRVIASTAFAHNTEITYVELTDSVREIEPYAFSGCTEVTHVRVQNVDVIGKGAFFGCTKLESVFLKEGITAIPDQLFYGCESLWNYAIPDSVQSIGVGAFYGCDSLTTLAIPGNVTQIGASAYGNCAGLANVVLPQSLESLGAYAFNKCGALEKVTFLGMDTAIADTAFPQSGLLTLYGFDGSAAQSFAQTAGLSFTAISETSQESDFEITDGVLTRYTGNGGDVSIPEGVTEIGDYAFGGCHSLLSVTMPDTVTHIRNRAFSGCTNLKSIRLSGGLTVIEPSAFANCAQLQSIVIPGSVQTLGNWMFENCRSLTSVVLEEGIAYTDYSMFYGCTSLVSVSLPESLETVGEWTFHGCSTLEHITFPAGVKSIGYGALYGCNSLKSVTFAGKDTQIGESVLPDEHLFPTIYGHCGSQAEEIARQRHLLFSGCECCVPENPCAHENTFVMTQRRNEVYSIAGDLRMHSVTYDEYSITCCTDCGAAFGHALTGEGVTQNENHWWEQEGGLCHTCGQTNTCSHESTERSTYTTNHSCTSTGDYGTHTVTYDEYAQDYCMDCGLWMSDVLIAEDLSAAWDHDWDENGVCYGCGQENTCPHENPESRTYSRNHQYVSTGDHMYHQYVYDEYRVIYCGACHVTVSEAFETTHYLDREHSWSWSEDSVCTNCGQENTCPHARTQETIRQQSDYVQLDDNLHMKNTAVSIRTGCTDCGRTLFERDGSQYTLKERHNYSDEGVCRVCDAPNTCAHERLRQYESNRATIETQDLSDGTHRIVIEKSGYWRCEACSMRIEDNPWTETEEVVAAHEYPNRCDICGYSVACAHGNLHGYEDWLDARYGAIDENHHGRYGRIEEHEYCEDCGEEIRVTEYKVETLLYTDVHSWNSSGVCRSCGYENPCAHESPIYVLRSVDSSEWIALDENRHQRTRICKENLICADCGAELGQIGGLTEITNTERHSFYEGSCDYCGYANTCAHDEETYQETHYWDNCWDIEAVDASAHRCYTTEIIITYCALCDEAIADQESERAWREYPHEMYGDQCAYCEYRIDCAHESIGYITQAEIYDRYSCTSVSDAEHESVYSLYRYETCADCGTVFENRNGTQVGMITLSEAHSFVGGVCSECGFVEPEEPEPVPGYAGTIAGDVFFNLDWTKYKSRLNEIGFKSGGTAKLRDLQTGTTMSIYVQSTGNHADVEPLTAADTAAMCSMYGVAEAGSIGWQRRPAVMLISYNGISIPIVCSIYGQPHGQQNIIDNNFEGQFCVHFLGSTIHVGNEGNSSADHQDMIKKAVSVLLGQGKICKTTLTDEDIGLLVPEPEEPEVPKTREEILAEMGADKYSVYQLGSTGSAVMKIQEMLKALEIYYGEVTGSFGSLTEKAVSRFQLSRGLEENGVCDYETLVNIIDVYLGKTEPSCLHLNTSESVQAENETYTLIDENYHEYAFDAYIRVYCRDCGKTPVYRAAGSFKRVMPHSNAGENLCACGHEMPAEEEEENPCAHERVTPRIYKVREWAYEDLGDGLHHKVTRTGDMYDYCDACGERVGERYTGSVESVAQHSYPGGCPSCSYSTDCAHEGSCGVRLGYEDMQTLAIDDVRHGSYGIRVESVFCWNCGQTVSEQRTEEAVLCSASLHRYSSDGTCYACGAQNTSCAHENQTTVLEEALSVTPAVNSYWREYSDKLHVKTILYAERTACADCGMVIGGIGALRQKEVYEPHDIYDGGWCECGYQNACAHAGETYTRSRRGEWWDTFYVDENTHLEDASYLEETVCSDCGQVIASVEGERQRILRSHTMEDGECWECGYVPCAHENVQQKTVVRKQNVLYAESISANAHALICEKQLVSCCPDCGIERGGMAVGTATVYQPHEFADGRCTLCRLCEHPQQLRSTENTSYESTALYYNAYLHEIVQTVHRVETCGLCGDMLREWNETQPAHFSRHIWDDSGACHGCGSRNTCTHEDAYHVTQSGGSATYEDADDEYHIRFFMPSTHMYCPDCLHTWAWQQGEVAESLEKHSYGWNATECMDCGHENTCLHENTEEHRTLEETTGYDYVDAYTHNWRGNIYVYDRCLDCGARGMNMRLVEEDAVYMSEHHYFNDEGVCDCGYTRICTHKNTVESYWGCGSYTKQLDATHHIDTTVYSLYTVCADCGKRIADMGETIESPHYSEHHFSEEGFCYSCYFQIVCDHADTETITETIWSEYIAVDETQHQLVLELYETVVCADCGVWLSDEIVGSETVIQLHNIAGCGCEDCGYTTGAAHAHTEMRDVWSETVSAEAVDADTHSAVVSVWLSEFCTDCGAYTGYEMRGGLETRTQPHNFGSSDRCYDCGYVTLCAHEETTEKRTETYAYGYAPQDDQLHTWQQDYYVETVCADCGRLMHSGEERGVTVTGEHVYADGEDTACSYCGYIRTQTEGGPVRRLTLPGMLTTIEAEAFMGNTQITHVKIPDGVTSIGDYAFAGCTGLRSVEIPASVEIIGAHAFDGCTGLTHISLPDGAAIGEDAFNGCPEQTGAD